MMWGKKLFTYINLSKCTVGLNWAYERFCNCYFKVQKLHIVALKLETPKHWFTGNILLSHLQLYEAADKTNRDSLYCPDESCDEISLEEQKT